MKSIRVSDQPDLPFRRVVRITVEGIRYRLFRASVTVAVIAVAVAFLLNILSESLIKRAVASETRDRVAESRLAHRWLARLSEPADAETVLRALAAAEAASPELQEVARLAGLSATETAELQQSAVSAVRYLDFLAGLDYARRRRLTGSAEGVAVLDRLATEQGLAAFRERLASTRSVRLPGAFDELSRALARWPATREGVRRVQAGQREAVARVAAALEGRRVLDALAEADGAFGEAVRAAGFAMAPAEAAQVARQARRALDVRLVEKTLDRRAARQAVARYYDKLPADISMALVWRYLTDPSGAAEYHRVLNEERDAAGAMPPARLVELAGQWREGLRLERSERLTADLGVGWLGMGDRMAWLLCVSLLVCAIGICNAMLMTVTERFREIATLKCLGALDGTIMLLFVLESCFLGVIGGCVGGLAGAVLGTARTVAAFGPSFMSAVPFGELAAAIGAAVLVGVVLAALAAVYPSFRAARLAPMEAMRVE